MRTIDELVAVGFANMADFIEYVNGPADSPWGLRRAADGHPAPNAKTVVHQRKTV